MSLPRVSLIVFAVFAVIISLGFYSQAGVSEVSDSVNCGVSEQASAAACGRCGDGACVKSCGENAKTCPADCGGVPATKAAACGKCGDGVCVKSCGETPQSCPADCGGVDTSAVPVAITQ